MALALRCLQQRLARCLSRWLFRRGVLAGQVYDTRRPVQPTTLVCLDGRIEKLAGAAGVTEGPPRDWLNARAYVRRYNMAEERERWIVKAVWFRRR